MPSSGADTTSILPPDASTIHFAIDNPSPLPCVPERAAAPRKNRSKMRGRSSEGIPTPLSATLHRISPPDRCAWSVIVPRFGVYLPALSSSTRSACFSIVMSPATYNGAAPSGIGHTYS